MSIENESHYQKIARYYLSSQTRVSTENESVGEGPDVVAYFKANQSEELKRLVVFMYNMGFRDGKQAAEIESAKLRKLLQECLRFLSKKS